MSGGREAHTGVEGSAPTPACTPSNTDSARAAAPRARSVRAPPVPRRRLVCAEVARRRPRVSGAAGGGPRGRRRAWAWPAARRGGERAGGVRGRGRRWRSCCGRLTRCAPSTSACARRSSTTTAPTSTASSWCGTWGVGVGAITPLHTVTRARTGHSSHAHARGARRAVGSDQPLARERTRAAVQSRGAGCGGRDGKGEGARAVAQVLDLKRGLDTKQRVLLQLKSAPPPPSHLSRTD
jgi:hypothetical protein